MLSSGTFTFLIGPERQEYVIHKAAFANLSPDLDAIMNNATGTSTCVFDDTEENIFKDLIEYAYTGSLVYYKYDEDASTEDQHYPAMVQAGEKDMVVHGNDAPPCTFKTQFALVYAGCQNQVRCSHCGQKSCKMPPCLEYSAFLHIQCKYEEDAYETWEKNVLWAAVQQVEDCSDALLNYAKLYMLSDRFKIKGLKLITCRCIFMVLVNFPVIWERIPDLIPLIRFIYSSRPSGDPPRHMVAAYTAAIKEKLMVHPEFNELLQEQMGFCHDVLSISAGYSRAEKQLRHHR